MRRLAAPQAREKEFLDVSPEGKVPKKNGGSKPPRPPYVEKEVIRSKLILVNFFRFFGFIFCALLVVSGRF